MLFRSLPSLLLTQSTASSPRFLSSPPHPNRSFLFLLPCSVPAGPSSASGSGSGHERQQTATTESGGAAADGGGSEWPGGSEVDGPDGEEDDRGPGRRRSRAEAARAKRTQGRRPRAGRAKSVAGDQDLEVVPVRASPPCLLCSSIWLARFFI